MEVQGPNTRAQDVYVKGLNHKISDGVDEFG